MVGIFEIAVIVLFVALGLALTVFKEQSFSFWEFRVKPWFRDLADKLKKE